MWEIEKLKGELRNLKYDVDRKVEDSEHRRLRSRIESMQSEINNITQKQYEMEQRIADLEMREKEKEQEELADAIGEDCIKEKEG